MLIKNGQPLADPWTTVADDAALPAGAVIVGLGRWQRDREALLGRNQPIGVGLPPDRPVEALAADLGRLGVVALEFRSFRDGRAYSQARLLRERYRYAGEIRATGQVLRDQLLFMERCGIDAFQVADEARTHAWPEATREISVWYQPAADRRTWVVAARHGKSALDGCAPAG
jgi:uncharacterized protein (DUF934 family)